MPNVPDYSLYVGSKKISVSQTANTNTAIVKSRAPNRYDGYFPLYKGIKLPQNALVSNKFTVVPPPGPPILLPTDIAGLRLWLDAADPSGNNTTPTNGSTLSTWVDKSGQGNNATVQSGTPTYSSNGVVFTGSQIYQTSLSSVNNTQTFFAVMSFTSANTMNIVGVKTTTTNNGYQYLMIANQQYITRFGGTLVVTGATLTQSTQSIYGAVINGGSTSFVYSNGSQTGTAGATATVGGTAVVTIGAHSDNPPAPSSGFIGTINEVIMFYAILTTSQRQQIEGYLAWKWGLQGNLPADHPYKSAKPTV